MSLRFSFLMGIVASVVLAVTSASAQVDTPDVSPDPDIVQLPEQRQADEDRDDWVGRVEKSFGMRLSRSVTSDKVMIVDIEPKGVAQEAGLREGDVIEAVDARTVSSAEGLSRFLSTLENNEKVTLTVVRGERKGKITLSAKAEGDEADAAGLPGNQKNVLGMTLIENPEGEAIVESVAPTSAAADAGIQKGDRIIAIGGKRSDSFRELYDQTAELLSAKQEGEQVQLQLMRGEEQLTTNVMLPYTPERVPYQPRQFTLPRASGTVGAQQATAGAAPAANGAATGYAGYGSHRDGGTFIGALPSGAVREAATNTNAAAGAVVTLHRVNQRGGGAQQALSDSRTGNGADGNSGAPSVNPADRNTPANGVVPANGARQLPSDFEGPLPGPNPDASQTNGPANNGAVNNNASAANARGAVGRANAGQAANAGQTAASGRRLFPQLPANYQGPLATPRAGTAQFPGFARQSGQLPPDFEGPLPGPGQQSGFNPIPVEQPGRPALPPDFEGPLPGPGGGSNFNPIPVQQPGRPELPSDFEGQLPGPPGDSQSPPGSGGDPSDGGGADAGGGEVSGGLFNVQDNAQPGTPTPGTQPPQQAPNFEGPLPGPRPNPGQNFEGPLPGQQPNPGQDPNFEGPLPGPGRGQPTSPNANNTPFDDSPAADTQSRLASSNDDVVGFVQLTPGQGQVVANISLAGLDPGQYLLAIHEYGDCGDLANHSAGNIVRMLGAVIIDESGQGQMQLPVRGVELGSMLGHSLLVHSANAEDSSTPVACGIIGRGHPGRWLVAGANNGSIDQQTTAGQADTQTHNGRPARSPRGVPQQPSSAQPSQPNPGGQQLPNGFPSQSNPTRANGTPASSGQPASPGGQASGAGGQSTP